jgi:hypothetical protein
VRSLGTARAARGQSGEAAATFIIETHEHRVQVKPPQQHEVDTEQMDIAQARLAALVDAANRRALQRERELAEEAANVNVDSAVTH